MARVFPSYSKKTTSTPIVERNSSGDLGAASKTSKVIVEFIVVDENNGSLSPEEAEILEAAAESIQLTCRIVDTPCNEMHTDAFVKEVEAVAKNLGLKAPLIIRGEELDKQGFGGIYGVGKGAAHPPALVILSHTPKNATETIAWVGKGIVYDTGGLSIKVTILSFVINSE